MLEHKYGNWTDSQIESITKSLQKQIFFLLLIVDPKTKKDYETENINVEQAFVSLLRKLGGMNSLLNESPELIQVMSLIEAARLEYNNPNFEFGVYRKLVLDAGANIKKIKEV